MAVYLGHTEIDPLATVPVPPAPPPSPFPARGLPVQTEPLRARHGANAGQPVLMLAGPVAPLLR